MTIRLRGLLGEKRQVHQQRTQYAVRALTPRVSDNSRRKMG